MLYVGEYMLPLYLSNEVISNKHLIPISYTSLSLYSDLLSYYRSFLVYSIKLIEKMQEIVNKEFNIAPDEITHFIRGILYVHVHAIIMFSEKLSPNMLQFYVDFLKKYLDFFLEYLKIFPECMEEYVEGLKTNNEFLYLVNRKIAVVSCYHELFNLTKLILSTESDNVTNNFYKV